jgi:VWFA-related protein
MSRGVTLSVMLACAAQALAQSQVLIKLNVAATDGKGAPVTDLRAADMQVREDSKLRPLVFFHFAGSRNPAPPGPNEFTNKPSPPPTLILLDAWNQQELSLASASQEISAAIAHLENVDRVYVYLLNYHGDLIPVRPLPGIATDSRAYQPTARELAAKFNGVAQAFSGLRDASYQEPFVRPDTTLQGLGIVSRMASIPGPEALIWITHGFPLQAPAPSGEFADYTKRVRDLCRTALRAQTAIYTVDESARGAYGSDVFGSSIETLQLVSGLTGGRAYSVGRTSDAIAGVLTDARARYQLAYYTPLEGAAQKEHKLRVDSTRKGVRLMTRQSYFVEAAPDPDEVAEDSFANESHSQFDATEIALRVAMSCDPALHLDIHIDPADVLFERRGDRLHDSLSMKFALYRDDVFRGAQTTTEQDLDLTQEQYNSALRNGIAISRDVAVDAQIQQLRVMVFDHGSRGLGSAGSHQVARGGSATAGRAHPRCRSAQMGAGLHPSGPGVFGRRSVRLSPAGFRAVSAASRRGELRHRRHG